MVILLHAGAAVTARGISLVVVAGVRLYREGLAALLGSRPNVTLVGAAATAEEAIALVAERRPHLVTIDAGTPDSLAIAEHILRLSPATRVIAFGMTEDEPDVQAWATAGATGFVTREGSIEELTTAMETVMRGEVASTPRIGAMLLRRLARRDRAEGSAYAFPSVPLTSREREIVTLIDLGLTNKEIAQRLNIEVCTVKNHVHHLLQKLNVTSRAAAAARLRGPARSPSTATTRSE